MRIGHGFDVHAFAPGDHLMLGGVRIPYHRAFRAHSDGDVLLHALADALLGAIGAGDIGRHFPDTDPAYQGIDSRVLLRDVYARVVQAGWCVGNADMTIIAQKPRMAGHLTAMKECIAVDLQTTVAQLNIKATTTEKLGFCGREEGIAAHAVVLLMPLAQA